MKEEYSVVDNVSIDDDTYKKLLSIFLELDKAMYEQQLLYGNAGFRVTYLLPEYPTNS